MQWFCRCVANQALHVQHIDSVTLQILGEMKFIHAKNYMKPYKIDKTAQEAAQGDGRRERQL